MAMHPSCILVVAAVLCVSLMQVSSLNADDRIDSLPGQPMTPNNSFSQFSGYITVDDEQKTALFYYFVEAEGKPETKPLVLWLNGGPGCSSVGYGAFGENGPFRPTGEVLKSNEFSWNKEANMLYLETPAGVGFSYSKSLNVNDKTTARDNLKFLELWLVKFPEYKKRDFFITGESYAGHYVPQLAQLIIHQSPNISRNLKGLAIGNPLLNFDVDFGSTPGFLWSHGVVSDSTYELLKTNCSHVRMRREYYDTGNYSKECNYVWNITESEMGAYVDVYDVLSDYCLSNVSQSSSLHHPMMMMLRKRFQSSSARYHSRLQEDHQNAAEEVDVCPDDKTTNYLNRKDVQKALRARLVGVKEWNPCSETLKYDMKNLEISVIEVLGTIVKAGFPVLVYSGDQDSVIPFTGTRTNVATLAADLGLITDFRYRSWFDGYEVAGWTEAYGGNKLSFATIRGAAHEVPYSSPQLALTLFRAFISRETLPIE